MPSFKDPIDLEEGLAIGHRPSKWTSYWYSRHYHPSQDGSTYNALKIQYEKGAASQRRASKLARDIHHNKFLPAIEAGQHPSSTQDIEAWRKKYLRWCEGQLAANQERVEAGLPMNVRNITGQTIMTEDKMGQIRTNLEAAAPWLATLPVKNIRKIQDRHLNTFLNWSQRNTDWAPSTMAYRATEIRNIFRFAYEQGMVDRVPTIKVQERDLRRRKRKPFTPHTYQMVLDYARNQYSMIDLDENPRMWKQKDQRFQFLCFVELAAWSGYRPPSGPVEKNFPKWEHIKPMDLDPNKDWVLYRESEKGLEPYDAFIQKPVRGLLLGLRELYKKRGMNPTYLFEHTDDRGLNWSKGDPYKSIKTRWKFMLEALRLDAPKGSPQSERLVPYGLRAYYITQRLRAGVDIYTLERATGTSAKMIKIIYDDFRTIDTAPIIGKNTPLEREYVEKYDKNGDFIF